MAPRKLTLGDVISRSFVVASAVVALAVTACTSSSQPAQTPATEPAPSEASPAEPAPADAEAHHAGPVGTKLVRDVTESPETYEIGEGGSEGLAGYMISHDGKALWPPTGPQCEMLVSCCQAIASQAKPVALTCLLAVARDKDCGIALSTVRSIVTEQSYAMPGQCQP